MAYHGYIPHIHSILSNFENPRILEIGICDGISTFSLLQRICRTHRKFKYTGVDVLLRKPVIETLRYMMFDKDQIVELVEENSLKYLKNTNDVFDVIFVDGDHNYYTVSKELEFLEGLSYNKTIIVCDDYSGRWSNRDLFYSEKEIYKDNEKVTQRISAEKEGVQPAVDDFIKNNDNWIRLFLMEGEPVVLIRKDNPFLRYE